MGALGVSLSFCHFVASAPGSAWSLAQLLRRTALVQVTVLTLAHVVAVIALVGGGEAGLVAAGAVTLVSVPISFMSEYSLAGIQGVGRFQLVNVLRLMSPVAYAVLLLFPAVAGDASLLLVAALVVLANGVAAAVAAVYARRLLTARNEPPQVSVGQMRAFAIRSYAGYFSPLEAFKLDQILVGLVVSPAALGYYVAGAAFANLPRFFGSTVGLIAAPAISAERDPARQSSKLVLFTGATTALTLAVALPLIGLVGYLLPLLFGEDFRAGVPVAQWLLVASVFLAIRRVLANSVRGFGVPLLSAPSEVLSTAVFSVGIFLLGSDPELSSVGALFAVSNGLGCALLAFRVAMLLRRRT